jgi:hypothetical protein
MTDFSPAAQAVMNAADSAFDQAGTTRQGIAAALRAVVDQTITERLLNSELTAEGDVKARLLLIWARDRFRAIATELETTHD